MLLICVLERQGGKRAYASWFIAYELKCLVTSMIQLRSDLHGFARRTLMQLHCLGISDFNKTTRMWVKSFALCAREGRAQAHERIYSAAHPTWYFSTMSMVRGAFQTLGEFHHYQSRRQRKRGVFFPLPQGSLGLRDSPTTTCRPPSKYGSLSTQLDGISPHCAPLVIIPSRLSPPGQEHPPSCRSGGFFPELRVRRLHRAVFVVRQCNLHKQIKRRLISPVLHMETF